MVLGGRATCPTGATSFATTFGACKHTSSDSYRTLRRGACSSTCTKTHWTTSSRHSATGWPTKCRCLALCQARRVPQRTDTRRLATQAYIYTALLSTFIVFSSFTICQAPFLAHWNRCTCALGSLRVVWVHRLSISGVRLPGTTRRSWCTRSSPSPQRCAHMLCVATPSVPTTGTRRKQAILGSLLMGSLLNQNNAEDGAAG